jgi:hypothetical protein
MALFWALLHLKDNYVFRIPKFWVLRVPPIQIPTQNGKMKILKFVNLKVSYKFRILNSILHYLLCNMMKVFTRPTSASDFFSQNSKKFMFRIKIIHKNYHLDGWNIVNRKTKFHFELEFPVMHHNDALHWTPIRCVRLIFFRPLKLRYQHFRWLKQLVLIWILTTKYR